ncbi:MAG: hypothetical protein KAT77_03820 [Nanoarchaeota archaeon]|nr:hypothetical protein [Nanoarchaeota archaeon]
MDEKERVRRIVSDLGSVVSSSNPERYLKRIAENLDRLPLDPKYIPVFTAYTFAVASVFNEAHFPVFREKYRQSRQLISGI